ncbi:MAG: ankyrin repeat domain-containing protein, partial [Pseudomonadota bacterium]
AAYKGYGDIVTMLLTSGADVKIRDSKGDTALKIAARAGFSRVVDQLKKAGATD